MRRRDAILCVISIAIVAALFWWEGHLSFSLTDEGYLWYGVRQSMHGEVPVRDFQAYEPGRYYWSVVWLWLQGSTGIVAIRVAIAAFQAIAVFFLLRLFLKVREDRIFAAASVVTALIWMGPRHKLFDIVASISLVAALCYYASAPDKRRALIAGSVVGLAGFFGRNHGFYGFAGSMILFLLLAIGGDWKKVLGEMKLWSLGLLAGCAPLIGMLLFVPGYAKSVLDSFLFLAQIKGTNLPVPVPWPWRSPIGTVPNLESRVTGVFFILLLVFAFGGFAYLVANRKKHLPMSPVLMASVAMALPYTHFAFSRAEAFHLAQGIFPCLIGVLALVAALPAVGRYVCLTLLICASFLVARHNHPGFEVNSRWQVRQIHEDRLTIEPDAASQADFLERVYTQYGQGKMAAIMPFWPGAYPLLNQHCPTYEIYGLFARTPEFERTEIAKIEADHPQLIVITNTIPDGNTDLRFAVSHPLTNAYILSHYTQMPNEQGDGPFLIYTRSAP